MQLDDKLHQASKTHNMPQVCGVSAIVEGQFPPSCLHLNMDFRLEASFQYLYTVYGFISRF